MLLHLLHVTALLTFVTLAVIGCFFQEQKNTISYKTTEQYGTVLVIIFSLVQLLVLLPVPQVICQLLGLVISDAFPGEIKRRSIPSEFDEKFQDKPIKPRDLPHLCFRIVTRGLFPELVQKNVQKNFLTCIESGLTNFSVEVVTDKEINICTADERIRQLIVPLNYKTSTGALFKARALQYALEPQNSPIQDGDYIVHLDEETLVTKNVINGIINFALDGKHAFGQGLITYANIEIINLLTTLADSYRVADDMGKLRFTLGTLHKPVFGWKGSFVVTKLEAEKDVSFDHGPDGSIAEDCYFSMVAIKKGYTFDFIQGEMFEKSPFTIMDLIKQRKRWMQGIWLVVNSCHIPIKTKFFLAISLYTWLTLPISLINYMVTLVFPMPTLAWLAPIGSFCLAVTLYMYIFGLVKSFDLKKRPFYMLFVYLIGQLSTLFFNIIIENIAVVWGLIDNKYNFFIVQKETGH